MNFLIGLLVVLFLCFLLYFIWKWIHFYYYKKNLEKKAEELRFLQVKIPRRDADSDQSQDNVQSMKQNIEIMTQFLNSLSSMHDDSYKAKFYWQKYISLEIYVEKEVVKFALWVPKDHIETFEKLISSFYAWAVIDYISQPNILEWWKFADWWYFSLAKKDELPIQTYENLEADPMDSILSTFSMPNRDEKLLLQVITTPMWEKEQSDFKKSIESEKKDDWWGIWAFLKSIIVNLFNFEGEWKDDSSDDKKEKYSWNLSSEIDKKAESEMFRVQIRAIATSVNQDRPQKILKDLERSISQYHLVWLNKIKFSKMKDFESFCKDVSLRLPIDWYFSYKNIKNPNLWQRLSKKEVASLYHLPHSRYNKNSRIKWQNYKIVAAPDGLPKDWILLGHNLFAWQKKEVRLSAEDRFRHFYCIWQTGTGKTTMLLNQAKDDLQNWRWFCFIDPHGDFCEDLLWYFPKERINDLIYFDASNFEYPMWLNAFEAETEEEKDVVTNDLVDMFIQLYWHEIFGPRLQDYFRNGALTLMDQPDWWTLVEIVRLFADEAFQKAKLKHLRNPVVRSWWEKTYAAMWDREKAEAIPFFQAKFGQFTTTPIIRNIIWQTTSSFNMFDAMQEWKVILVNLSKWLVWEINSELIWRILTTQIKVAALRRANMPAEKRQPFYLYIDEFQNYVSQSIESILSEARKYKLGLAVAHQYIDQLKTHWLWWDLDLSKAIFGNVWSIMAYKVWPEDAEFLERLYSPEFSKSDLVNMDKFKWVMRLSVDSQPTKPFSIAAENPYTPYINNEEKRDVIKEISALKWWRKKELVEKEVYYRVWA